MAGIDMTKTAAKRKAIKAKRKVQTKAQTTPDKFLGSSLSIIEGSGTLGQKQRPFNYQVAVDKFRSWVYAAAMLNAQGVASVPLRLYIKKRGGKKSLFQSRRPMPKQLKYMKGYTEQRPSWSVMTKVANWGDDFEEITESHPILDVLRKCNAFENSFGMSCLRILYLELTGNAYLHPVIGKGGIPSELWTMPSQWMSIIPSKNEFISAYVYGKTTTEQRVFAPDEVIHFKRPNPNNLFYGLGKVEAGWGVISLNEATHEMDQALFDNHARPDYAVIFKSGYADDTLTRFQSRVNSLLQGHRKAGGFLPISADANIVPLNFPPKDLAGREDIVEEIAAIFGVPVSMLKANDPNLASAETGFASWRETTILPICRLDEETLNQTLLPLFGLEDEAVLAYDNPVPTNQVFEKDKKIGFVQSGIMTRNEAREEEGLPPMEGGDELVVNQTPIGMLTSFQQIPFGFGGMSNNGTGAVLPPSKPAESEPLPKPEVPQEGNIETTQDTVLNGAQVTAASAIVQSVASGLMPRDSGIGQLEILFNLSNEQAERIMGSAGAGFVPASLEVPASEPNIDKDLDIEEPKTKTFNQVDVLYKDCNCGDHSKPISTVGKYLKAIEETAREDEPLTIIEQLMRDLEVLFAQMFASVMGAVSDQKARTVKALRDDGVSATINAYDEQLKKVLEPYLKEILLAGGKTGLENLGVATDVFDVTNPRVLEFIDNHILRLAGDLKKTTLTTIKDLIAQGSSEGWSTTELGAKIAETGVFSGQRAEMIARTESAYAYTSGEEEGWKESGVVEGKTWLLSPGACEFCVSVAEQYNDKPIPLGSTFANLGDTIKGSDGGIMSINYRPIDRPPLHPNCTCGQVASVNYEKI